MARASGSDIVKTVHHRIFRIRWCRNGNCYVTSHVNGGLVAAYENGAWDDLGRLPDDVKAAAEASKPAEPVNAAQPGVGDLIAERDRYLRALRRICSSYDSTEIAFMVAKRAIDGKDM